MARRGVKRTWIAAVAIALAAPQAAQAHLVATGMGPVYDGAAHVASSAEDLLPLAALALFAGLRGPAHARWLLFAAPAAWLAGGVLATVSPWSLAPIAAQAASALLLLGLGGLLALDVELPRATAVCLATGLGLLRGAADAAGLSVEGATFAMLLGAAATVFAGFALAASISLPLRRAWTRIAVRVVGSWVAATGLLLAGWTLRFGAIG